MAHALPMIPGWDFSGTVEAVGLGASKFEVGAAVFAMTGMEQDGAYAEYVAVPEDVLCMKPASVDLTTAAAISLAATTAWQTLRDSGLLVTTVGITTDAPETAAHGVQGKAFGAHPDAADLSEIARLMEIGHAHGKVVLKVS